MSDPPLDGRSPKYRVLKADGSPVDPNARYLVLRIDNKGALSPEAKALRAYLDAIEETHPDLWRHLVAFYMIARRNGQKEERA